MPRILYPILTEPVLPPAQQPEEVTESRWHQPFAQPVLRGGLAAAVVASGLFFTQAAPFAEAVAASKWAQPLSTPVKLLGLPADEQQSLAFVAAPAEEVVTLDKWLAPFGEPVRETRGILAASQRTLAFTQSDPFPEAVTADRWAQPLALPVRRPYGPPGIIGYVEAPPFPEATTPDRWYAQLSVPVLRGALPTAEQLFLAFVKADPFPEVVSAGWQLPLSVPSRALRRPDDQALSYSYYVAPVVSVAVEWLTPFSQPAPRSRSQQSAYALIKSAPFAEAVTADRWYQPLSRPGPRVVRHLAGQMEYFESASDQVLPLGWLTAVEQPLREREFRSRPVSVLVKAAPFPETVSADRWAQPLALPTRDLAARQHPFYNHVYLVVPVPPADWRVPLSEPISAIAVRDLGGEVRPQQVATQLPDIDWLQPLSVARAARKTPLSITAFYVFLEGGEPVVPAGWYHPLSQPVIPSLFIQQMSVFLPAFVRKLVVGPVTLVDEKALVPGVSSEAVVLAANIDGEGASAPGVDKERLV